MSLQKQLEADLKQAMLAKDAVARDCLRMVLSSARAREAEQGTLSDEQVRDVIATGIKTRTESLEHYTAAAREDLAGKERAEIEVLRKYLPQQLSEDEARALLRELATELGVSSKKDVGVLMKALMARHKGKVDGKLAQRLVGEILT